MSRSFFGFFATQRRIDSFGVPARKTPSRDAPKWFRERGRWLEGAEEPAPGMVV
jgi:hypothetical protein